MMRPIVSIPTLFVALVTFFVATTPAESLAAKGPVGEFRFINRGDIITLDLNAMSYLQDFRVTFAMREGLYQYDPKNNFHPDFALATEATQSADKKVWTIKLRQGTKWTNGDPVTAADFIFSWRNMLEAPGEYTSLFYYVKNAKAYEDAYRERKEFDVNSVGFRAVDDYTLEITLNNPVPFLPDLLAFPPFYPRHAKSMEPFRQTDDKGRVSYSAAYTRPGAVVTNGPFDLVAWEPGRRLRLEKSKTYWDKENVKLNAVTMIVNNDPQSAFVQYENGEVDWLADVSADIGADLKQANRKDLRVEMAYGTAFLTFNCAEKIPELRSASNPLSDVRVRKALAMSIDKAYLVENITRMGERTANSYVPPGFFYGWTSTPTPQYDIEGAKKLLAEAGHAEGKGIPTLSICYNSDNPTRKALAEYLAFEWKDQLGVPVELRPLELKTYRSYVTNKEYSIALVAWYGDYMDASTFTDKYRSNSLNNDSNWAPPAYDKLLDMAEIEPDDKKRTGYLMQAEAMLNTDLPIVPMYHYVNFTLHRDDVVGSLTNAKNLVGWKQLTVNR